MNIVRFDLSKKLAKLENSKTISVIVIIVLAVIGVRLLTLSHAQSPYTSSEAESGTISAPAQIESDAAASGGTAVRFGFPYTTALSVHVDGNQLVNGQGSVMRLLGADASGPEYCTTTNQVDLGYPMDPSEAAGIASWKMNAVRIPLNEDCWLGINGVSINGESASASAQTYQSSVESFVTDLNNDGIIAILDLHWSAPGTTSAQQQWPMPDEDNSPSFWTSVASAFKSNPAVMFDLFNEPYLGNSDAQTSTPPWTCWLSGCTVTDNDFTPTVVYTSAGMQQLVNDVRATGATQPIILGGLNYSSDPCGVFNKNESTAACPEIGALPSDPLNQLVVDYHNYVSTYCSTPSCWDTFWNSEYDPIKAANVPMMSDEFGEDDCSDTFMNDYMSWADQNNISYLAWAWVPRDSAATVCSTQNTPSTSTDYWSNYALIDSFDGTPNSVYPQGNNYYNHLQAVSPY